MLELLSYQEDDSLKFTIDAEDGDLSDLRVTLSAPENTPYEEGVFFLRIRILNSYPSSPPRIQFETKIYHPNIDPDTGRICLDEKYFKWEHYYILKNLINYVYYMLGNPNEESFINAEIANQYANDREKFNKTAREWTELYAVYK